MDFTFKGQRERVGAWLEERKARRENEKALKHHAAEQLHGHSRFFLLNVPMAATVCAALVEVYWAILFCVEATGRLDWNIETASGSGVAPSLAWDFAFSSHLPVFLGLACATAPIVMISMVWLPVQFAMRGFGRWRRGSLIAVGLLANALVIVSGTVVMNGNRQEQVREGLVVEQQAEQGRAGLEARRAQILGRLNTLTDSANTTLQAQAARAGAVGWDSYIQTAQRQATEGTISAARLALIERARGSAVAAEEYQRQIDDLTVQIATAPTAAAVAANVEDDVGQGLNSFTQLVEVYRPPFVALIATLIGVLGSWWTLAMLEGMNPRDVLRSGWAPEGLRIEDLRDQNAKPAQPMEPFREGVFDSDTGEELVPRRATWARKPKRKGKPEAVSINPAVPPDEKGVDVDGGKRIALGPDGRDGIMSQAVAVIDGHSDGEGPKPSDDRSSENKRNDGDGDEHGVLLPYDGLDEVIFDEDELPIDYTDAPQQPSNGADPNGDGADKIAAE